MPGACGRFYGLGEDVAVWIGFTGDDRHRAVLWRQGQDPVRLWVDGVAVEAGAVLDDAGYWVGGRFFVVAAEGPRDHPWQRYGPGALVSRIVSVLIYDAEVGSARVLVPDADEVWTDPWVVLVDGRLWVYGSGDDVGSGGGAPPRPVETS